MKFKKSIMKKNNCLSIVFLFFLTLNNFIFSQNSNLSGNNKIQLKGIIKEEESNAPLPYVNIGILNKTVGTVSDSSGNYNLVFGKENLADTLQISLVGYFTKKMLLNELLNADNKNIRLTKKITVLDEVVVTNKKTQSEILGKKITSKFMQVSIFNDTTSVESVIGSEFGTKIKTKRRNAVLKNVNWYLTANNFKTIKFRVNIYSVKNELPDALLCNKEVFATIQNYKTGWNEIDLERYNIPINGDFVITLQWIDGEKNKIEKPMIMIPAGVALSKNIFAKRASQDKWIKMPFNLGCYVTLLY